MEETTKKIEGVVRALATEILNKFEKKKKIDNIQDLVVLATYLNMRKLDELREEVDNIMRAFQRLDALVEVVKELKVALNRLEEGQTGEATRLLKEVNTKLDQILEKLGAFSIEEV